jgi:hypothetical protein
MGFIEGNYVDPYHFVFYSMFTNFRNWARNVLNDLHDHVEFLLGVKGLKLDVPAMVNNVLGDE